MILVDMSSPFKRKEGLDTIRLLRNHVLSASIPIVAVCDATRDDGVLQEGSLVSFTYQLIIAMQREGDYSTCDCSFFQIEVSDVVYLPLNIRRYSRRFHKV